MNAQSTPRTATAESREGTAEKATDLLLVADGVEVRFGGLAALTDVSINVPYGSIVGLIGPNGAGKSTLFGVLTGYLRPLRGAVRFAGQDVTRLAPQRRARLGMGRSFQHPELFASLTVAEHLLLGCRMGQAGGRVMRDLLSFRGWRGPTPVEIERVEHVLEMLELEALADQACVALPTGIARLVEVGRVLAMDPKLVLLDEPAAGLDDRETDHLERALRQVMTNGELSILIVEHDLEFVFGLCEATTVLDAGVVIARGTPDEVRGDPAVQKAYLGGGYATP